MPPDKPSPTDRRGAPLLPVLFVSHGAPDIALQESSFSRSLESFGRRFDPRAFVVVSAHWEARRPVRVTSSPRPGIVHDFGGFADELYRLDYPAPGDPELAREIIDMLGAAGTEAAADPARPLDHGTWVPLRFLRPAADRPVLQISLPRPRSPEDVLAMGSALSGLRRRSVLLVGSGGAVHNLSRLRFAERGSPPDRWAVAFENWMMERIRAGELDRLLRYREEAPGVELAVPSTEHLDPLFFVLGARLDDDRFDVVHSGIEYGNLSLAVFAFESPAHLGQLAPDT